MPDYSDDIWTCNSCGAENPDWNGFCPLCQSGRGGYTNFAEQTHESSSEPGNTQTPSTYTDAAVSIDHGMTSHSPPRIAFSFTDVEGSDHRIATRVETPGGLASALPEGHEEPGDQEDNTPANPTRSEFLDLVDYSEFSQGQTQTATEAFVSIVELDRVLGPLYETARNNPKIGARELQRHVRSSLISYAEDLKGEAKNAPELSASRLVRIKAGHAARVISNNDQSTRLHLKVIADESSDEEGGESSLDESQFNDIFAFRSFLTQSNAFTQLRARTELLFATQSSTSVTGNEVVEVARLHPSSEPLRAGLVYTVEKVVFSRVVRLCEFLGCRNPPLAAGWTRIKVECNTCGERFFDDVPGHSRGDIARLKHRIELTIKATITVVHPGEDQTSDSGSWQVPPLVYNTRRIIMNILRWRKPTRGPVLPEHNDPQLRDEPQNIDPAIPSIPWLHLMSCVHRNWEHRILLQGRVEHIKTDLELFVFLKTQVRQRRCRMMRMLSCRKIQGVHFTMFKVRMGNRLEVRDHNDCCKTTCNCLPPPTCQDYDFERVDDYPIIPPRAFAHMLKHPKRDIHEDQTHIYRWIPKLRGTALAVDAKKELAEGWGLYFEEGWDLNDIMTLFGLIFIASLVFLVCWSKYTSDVSAASGVSSYMITVAGIAISLLVIRAGSM